MSIGGLCFQLPHSLLHIGQNGAHRFLSRDQVKYGGKEKQRTVRRLVDAWFAVECLPLVVKKRTNSCRKPPTLCGKRWPFPAETLSQSQG